MIILEQKIVRCNSQPVFFMAVCTVALIAVWRILQLFSSSFNLSFDEAQYWTWSQSFEWGYFSKPPLIAWVIALTTGVGGDDEPWVRIGAALAHIGTAFLLYGVGSTLFPRTHLKAHVGFWSALTYLTLPAVSVSSIVISTDAFLLFFWALALLSVVKIMDGASGWWWAALSIGLGFGLLSKYAMAFFVISLSILGMWSQSWRCHVKRWPFWAAILGGLIICAPNIWWNITNGLVSYRHTGANASLGADMFHPLRFVEFFASQAAVFGPLLFVTLCVLLARRSTYVQIPRAYGILIAFSFPVLAIMSLQAFLSRANANWAAPAFVAATPLVVAWCLEKGRWGWILKVSIPLHIFLALILYNLPTIETALGQRFPPNLDMTRRLYGWDKAGEWVRTLKRQHPDLPLLFDDRKTMATLLYYAYPFTQDSRMWFAKDRPENHYEMSVPFDSVKGQDVLYVAKTSDIPFRGHFVDAAPVSVFQVSDAGRSLKLYAYRLSHFLGYSQ